MIHKTVLSALIGGVISVAALPSYAADWKPAGPLKLQIGFGAGGSTDTIGRVLAAVLKEQTGWNVIAENKPGGGGVAMFSAISKAKPDGQVIGLGVNMPIMINLLLRGDKLPFKLDSFDYLATVSRAQLAIIARSDAPFNDVKGLVAYSKKVGGAAVGFDAKPQQLMMQVINRQDKAGLKMVSTKSSAEIQQYLLGGQIVAGFSAGTHVPALKSGKVKMLASANDSRHSYAPNAATLREQGYNVFVDPYWYIAAPKGLAPEVKKALSDALAKAIGSDKVGEVVRNGLASPVVNLGPQGTEKMLQDGMGGVKILFGK